MLHYLRIWLASARYSIIRTMMFRRKTDHASLDVSRLSRGKVTLKHERIDSLNWPGMTMAFAVKDKALLDKVEKGSKAGSTG